MKTKVVGTKEFSDFIFLREGGMLKKIYTSFILYECKCFVKNNSLIKGLLLVLSNLLKNIYPDDTEPLCHSFIYSFV